MAIIGANCLTARPSEVALLHRAFKVSRYVLGGSMARFNTSFELIFPTVGSSGVWTGLDEAFARAVEEGQTDLLSMNISPYVSTSDASWAALIGEAFGGALWPVKKRLPFGTDGVGTDVADAIVERVQLVLDYILYLCDLHDLDPWNVLVQVFQEPAIRYSDGPQETTGAHPAKTDAIAAGFAGYWDNNADWDAIAVDAGDAVYADVVGLQEWLSYIYNRIDPGGLRWVVPSIANGDYISAEASTIFQGPTEPVGEDESDWWVKMLDYTEAQSGSRVLHVGKHCYPGDMHGSGDPYRRTPALCANRFRLRWFRGRRALLDAEPELFAGALWYGLEFGAQPNHIFGGAGTNKLDEYLDETYGRYLAEIVSAMEDLPLVAACFEEAVLDSASAEQYALVNTDGEIRKAAAVLAASRGILLDTTQAPSWDEDLVWVGAPSEPVF